MRVLIRERDLIHEPKPGKCHSALQQSVNDIVILHLGAVSEKAHSYAVAQTSQDRVR